MSYMVTWGLDASGIADVNTWEWLFVAGVFRAWSHLLGSGLYGWVYVGIIIGLDYCMVVSL